MDTHQSGRKALLFIFVTVLIDIIGLGIIVPVLPKLLSELTGEAVSGAARYGGWLMFVYALMQFVFAPVMGNLSDRFGRRPVLLAGLSVLAVDYLVMGLAPSIGWLFAARLMSGMAGATYSTAYAYVADVSPPESRAQNFGLIGAAFGLGFIVGPVLGGLLGEISARAPFFAAAGFAALNVIYGLAILPETLRPENRRPFAWRKANPFGAFGGLRAYPTVAGVLGALALFQLAHHVNPSTWSYFTKVRFQWSEQYVGYSLGFVGLMIAIVQGGLIRWIIPKFGARLSALAGMVLVAVCFAGIAFADSALLLYAWLVPLALGHVAGPAMNGLLSNQIPDNSQGALQGTVAALSGITSIISPPVMTQLFAYFTGAHSPFYFAGAQFLLAAVLCLAAFAPLWWATRGLLPEREAVVKV